jgi:hypothetical protein
MLAWFSLSPWYVAAIMAPMKICSEIYKGGDGSVIYIEGGA